MNKHLADLCMNLLGGVLVIFMERLYSYLIKYFHGKNFKKIFGSSIDDFNIVYGKMALDKEIINIGQANENLVEKLKLPYVKTNSISRFKMETPVSFSEIRGAKYLSESYFNSLNKSAKLLSDEEAQTNDKVDISYCSLGGFNNFKTIEILNNQQNKFYTFEYTNIKSKIDNKTFSHTGKHHFALIIKLSNKKFPKRVQICIAGLGEWGTSGASWFLANKWKEIMTIANTRDFGAIIRVEPNKDESAELIDVLT